MFSQQLLDHFQNPRNPGEVSKADASVQLENPVCGDILKLTARVHGSSLTEIRFLVKGCVPVMACASAVTELAQGKTLDEAQKITGLELLGTIGGLPEGSAHASQLAMDALHALLNQLKSLRAA